MVACGCFQETPSHHTRESVSLALFRFATPTKHTTPPPCPAPLAPRTRACMIVRPPPCHSPHFPLPAPTSAARGRPGKRVPHPARRCRLCCSPESRHGGRPRGGLRVLPRGPAAHRRVRVHTVPTAAGQAVREAHGWSSRRGAIGTSPWVHRWFVRTRTVPQRFPLSLVILMPHSL